MFENLLMKGENQTNMKNYKGGYILISLGLIALSTSFSGTIDYDKVSATKKRVVLTDINVGGTKMPDVTVQPIYGNGTITFSNIYGYDIVVSSDNSVVVSEHQAPEDKGTRLYKHKITGLQFGYGSTDFIFISTKNTPLTNQSNYADLNGLCDISSVVRTSGGPGTLIYGQSFTSEGSPMLSEGSTSIKCYGSVLNSSTPSIIQVSVTVGSIADEVTEL